MPTPRLSRPSVPNRTMTAAIEQQRPAQLDVGEVVEAAARAQAEEQPEQDAGDQHVVMMLDCPWSASAWPHAERVISSFRPTRIAPTLDGRQVCPPPRRPMNARRL